MNLPLTNGVFLVSSSFLDSISRCAKESEFYKLHNKVRNITKDALNFGGILHSAMELHYRLKEFNLSKDETLARVARLMQKEFDKSPPNEGDFRTLNWAIEVYQRYSAKYNVEEFSLLRYRERQACKCCSNFEQHQCLYCNGTGYTSIMTEVSFITPLFTYKDIPVYYHGFIDLPVAYGDKIYTMDFKFTSMLGDSFWNDRQMSMQPKSYVWAWNRTTPLKAIGSITRAIRINTPPLYVQNGTANRKGEMKKIEDWWDDSMVEQRLPINEGELEEWEQNAIQLVTEFFHHYEQGNFPQHRTSCVHKYGKCSYYEICSTYPPKAREMILNSSLFINKPTNKKLPTL